MVEVSGRPEAGVYRDVPRNLWLVKIGDDVISEHASNAEAWRALDRLQGQPISKREDTADWIWRKGLDQ